MMKKILTHKGGSQQKIINNNSKLNGGELKSGFLNTLLQ